MLFHSLRIRNVVRKGIIEKSLTAVYQRSADELLGLTKNFENDLMRRCQELIVEASFTNKNNKLDVIVYSTRGSKIT